jgi:ribosomal protein S10
LPKRKKRITLLSSPHVNKVAREQFEITFYKSIFLIPINKTNNIFYFKNFLLNKPKNISLKIKIY